MNSAEQVAGPHTVREVKQRFRVHGLFHLPDLSTLAGVTEVHNLGVVEFVSTYVDTRDLRLAREGITLRRRTGSDEGWHLKLPVASDRPSTRDEFRLPLTGADQAPAALVAMIRIILRGAPLVQVATLRTARSRQLIRAATGDVAALVDDTVQVLDADGNVEARFRELELEEIHAGPVFERTLTALTEAGAVGGAFMAKVVRALGPRAVAAPEVPPPARAGPGDPARATIQAYLAAQVRALRAADLSFRREPADLEAVHQLRVATRRLRSGLLTFRPLVTRDWGTPLADELAWFGRSLGTLREASVLWERLADHTAELPAGVAAEAVEAQLAKVFGAAVADAQVRVTVMMNSERYITLHAALVSAVARPHTTVAAEQAANEALPVLVDVVWRRLGKAGSRLTITDPDERWHTVRLRAKRTRYAAEAVAGTFGKDAKVFARKIEELTDILGEHQDAAQAASAVQFLATSENVTAEVAFALGVLAAYERTCASSARELFLSAWPEVRRASSRRWLF